MLKLVFLCLSLGVIVTTARHIHPHHIARDGTWTSEQVVIDGMTVDMLRKVNSNGLVPVNNILFFRKPEPCEPGLKRDLFGICREVWDD